MSCKRRPRIRSFSITAGAPFEAITLPASTAAFVLRPRTAVGVQLRVDQASTDYFSLAAGETYTEEDLALDAELVIYVEAAADVVVEVWSWEG